MNIPDIIPVSRMEDYHTHYVGKFADGKQFWGRECVWVKTNPELYSGDADFLKYRKEYVMLHIFDSTGNHINTKHWYAGTSETADQKLMTNTLENWISELDKPIYCDIAIRLFAGTIDGFSFGLEVDEA